MKFASMASFLSSVFLFFALITGIGVSTLSNSLLTVATVIVNIGATCYMAAMLPFLTDQIIGATSDELDGVSDLMSPVQPLLTQVVTDDDHSKRNGNNKSYSSTNDSEVNIHKLPSNNSR